MKAAIPLSLGAPVVVVVLVEQEQTQAAVLARTPAVTVVSVLISQRGRLLPRRVTTAILRAVAAVPVRT